MLTDLTISIYTGEATDNFHGYELDWIRAEKNDSFVRQSSFKAVAMEELTDS
jgi:hypothetical protein